METIRDKNGDIIQQSRNLAGIRRYVGKNLIKTLDVCLLDGEGTGQLSILFDNACSFQTNFASYQILCNFVRNWRNVYGAPLSINGVASGKVCKSNPPEASRIG